MSQKLPQPSKNKPPSDNYARYSGLGLQMILIILLFVFGGHKLDVYFDFAFPIFTIILSIIGLIGAMWLLLKELLKK